MFNKFITPDTQISATYEANLLNGVMVLSGAAKEVERDGSVKDLTFRAIPYSTWNNRGADQMEVWIPESKEYATPTPEPTIASKAQMYSLPTQATTDVPAATSNLQWAWGYNDQWEPKRSSDTSKPYHYWWLRQGSKENVCYRFSSWKLYYKQGNQWKEVEAQSPYTTDKDRYNHLDFHPVKTTDLMIVAQLQEGASGGVIEWKVE